MCTFCYHFSSFKLIYLVVPNHSLYCFFFLNCLSIFSHYCCVYHSFLKLYWGCYIRHYGSWKSFLRNDIKAEANVLLKTATSETNRCSTGPGTKTNELNEGALCFYNVWCWYGECVLWVYLCTFSGQSGSDFVKCFFQRYLFIFLSWQDKSISLRQGLALLLPCCSSTAQLDF